MLLSRSALRFMSAMLLAMALVHPAVANMGEHLPSPEQIVARASHPIEWNGRSLAGPGAERLVEAAADAQFMILIESHNDQATPLITADLFRKLNQAHGFNYLAIEQDPFGMESASSPPLRGRLDLIAAYARSYPYSFTFSSDEELQLLAEAGRISSAGDQPIWGVDQYFGATAPLEELLREAPPGEALTLAAALLDEARALETRRDAKGRRDQANHHFLSSNAAAKADRLAALREAMAPTQGSRADELLNGLQTSAEIYSYYERAKERDRSGAPLGLLNNSVREDWMKRRFMRHYRAAEASDGERPRVLLKAGYWHAVRGRGPGNVFTLGNFLHEFAIAKGAKALTVQVVPLREWWPSHDRIDPPYRVLISPDALDRPTLVDLRPLRAHLHMGQDFELAGADLTQFRDLVFGVDYALFMPSRPAQYELTRCSVDAAGVNNHPDSRC